VHDILKDLQEQYPLLQASAALQLQAKTRETSLGRTWTSSATITGTNISSSSFRNHPNCTHSKNN